MLAIPSLSTLKYWPQYLFVKGLAFWDPWAQAAEDAEMNLMSMTMQLIT